MPEKVQPAVQDLASESGPSPSVPNRWFLFRSPCSTLYSEAFGWRVLHMSGGSNFSFGCSFRTGFNKRTSNFSLFSPQHSAPPAQHWKLIAGLGCNYGSLKGTKWQEEGLRSPEFEMKHFEGLITSSAAVTPAPVPPGLAFDALRETAIKSTDRGEHEKKASSCASS